MSQAGRFAFAECGLGGRNVFTLQLSSSGKFLQIAACRAR